MVTLADNVTTQSLIKPFIPVDPLLAPPTTESRTIDVVTPAFSSAASSSSSSSSSISDLAKSVTSVRPPLSSTNSSSDDITPPPTTRPLTFNAEDADIGGRDQTGCTLKNSPTLKAEKLNGQLEALWLELQNHEGKEESKEVSKDSTPDDSFADALPTGLTDDDAQPPSPPPPLPTPTAKSTQEADTSNSSSSYSMHGLSNMVGRMIFRWWKPN